MNIEESETNLSKNIENKEQEGMTNTEIKAPFKINKRKNIL